MAFVSVCQAPRAEILLQNSAKEVLCFCVYIRDLIFRKGLHRWFACAKIMKILLQGF